MSQFECTNSISSELIPLNVAASAPTAVFPPPTQSVVKVPAHAGLHRVKGNDVSFFQEMNELGDFNPCQTFEMMQWGFVMLGISGEVIHNHLES